MFKKIFYNDEDQFRPAVSYAVVGLAILLCGYYVYAKWNGSDQAVETNLKCSTSGCAYISERPLQVGEKIPLQCPKCDQRAVYPALPCPKCGTPNVLNQYLGKKPPTKCSKCGTELRYGG